MPGLAGYINKSRGETNSTLITDMSNILKHHEWYRTDNYTDTKRGLAISHVYLGLTESPSQPFISPDKQVKILMSGEIYNDDADDNNQLEYIYRQYQKEGADFASKLNGSFNIVVIDEAKDKVVIANDRTASRPFFYFVDGPTIYFAPELKSLLLVPSLKKTLNQSAIANFLACGYFINGETIIEGVKVLDNACFLEITPSGISTRRYWQFKFEEETEDKGPEYYEGILGGLIRAAVSRHTRTKHQYGILLSGGYDSRGILGCYLAEKGNNDLKTISWGHTEDVSHSDCTIAKKLAREQGLKHKFYELKSDTLVDNLNDFIYLSDGRTEAFTNYPESLKVFQKIRDDEGVQVILRGDECFGLRQNRGAYDERSVFRTLGLHLLSERPRYRNIIKDSYYKSFLDLNSRTMEAISLRSDNAEISSRVSFFYFDQRLKQYINSVNYDKSIEVELRNPWLDNTLLDFVRTVPSQYTIGKKLYKKTITTMFPALYKEVATKTNYVNWSYQFRNSKPLRDFIYRTLIEDRNALDEFINTDGLKAELDNFCYGKNQESLYLKLRTAMITIIKKVPAVYRMARKWSSKSNIDLPMEVVIERLLVLKLWCNIFMGPGDRKKPAAKLAEN